MSKSHLTPPEVWGGRVPEEPCRPNTLPPESEKDFLGKIAALAKALGYRTYHPWTSINSASGWPDLALAKAGRFILAELKTDRGRVTPAQAEWLWALYEAGVEVYVWRPRDFDDIVAILQGVRDDDKVRASLDSGTTGRKV